MQFAAYHPEEVCSFFAYGFNVTKSRRGREFSLCFDTWSNAIAKARENEREIVEERKAWLEGSCPEEFGLPWESARFITTQQHIVDYTRSIGLFAYRLSAEVYLEDCNWFFDEELDGNTRLVLWKVLERLLADDCFASLRLASPFRVGYQFDIDDIVVVRMLNWPKCEEPQGKEG